jgi:UDP-N-acetylmuramoyl-tripeptide--D-alanyl-D-alanine ligase
MLICVGEEAKAIASEAAKFGMAGNRIALFPDAAAAAAIASRLAPGDLVLLKASRAIGLEAVARAILGARPAPLAAAS